MIKYTNIELFKCLCLDLGWRYQRKELLISELGELRKQLLQLAEREWPITETFQWLVEFNELFSGSVCYHELNQPAVFRNVYQVLSFSLKIPKPHTSIQESDYIEKYKENENSCRNWRIDNTCVVTRLARHLVRRATLRNLLNPDLISEHGRHGPGAVFCKSRGSDKNVLNSCPQDLLSYVGHKAFLLNESWYCDDKIRLGLNTSRERFVEARLALVPKDWKGPRGVFISPKEAVFCQLGVESCLRNYIRSSWLSVCFDPSSQVASQEAAWEGAIGGQWFTADLSDASDRIPLSLVAYLFHRSDYLALAKTRPSYVHLPNGERMRMSMFAPMGDGKTFPVLSIVCAALSVAAVLVHDGWSVQKVPPYEVILSAARKIRVFGDDIAGRSRYFDAVCDALEIHNLKVNRNKSFAKGRFREACGDDYFKYLLVTPMRQRLDLDSADTDLLVKGVPMHNRMVKLYPHLVRTIAYIRAAIESRYPDVGYTTHPMSSPMSLHVSEYDLRRKILHGRVRWNSCLQRLEMRALVWREVSQYLPSNNPRWDMFYTIRRGSHADEVPFYNDRKVVVLGSPEATKLTNRALKKMGLAPYREPCERLVYTWLAY